jgi:enoyl-CoA hydratase
MQYWRLESFDGVVVAAYHNPPMNYFCAAGVAELIELIAQWQTPEVRAVVLTGASPGLFITHYSVEELHALACEPALLKSEGPAVLEGYHGMVTSLRVLPKPVIAALRGDTMGGGLELAMCCDIRIAAAGDFRLGLPEIRLGITPGGTGTQMLTRLVGLARAAEIVLRGKLVNPQRALEIGLVHEVASDPLMRATDIARDLARQPASAFGAAKKALYLGADAEISAGLAIEREQFLRSMMHPDAPSRMSQYIGIEFSARRSWIDSAT